jgi:hypothetical protein
MLGTSSRDKGLALLSSKSIFAWRELNGFDVRIPPFRFRTTGPDPGTILEVASGERVRVLSGVSMSAGTGKSSSQEPVEPRIIK